MTVDATDVSYGLGRPGVARLARVQVLSNLELLTVGCLFGLATIFARPQLEGWSFLHEFRELGIVGAWQNFAIGSAPRVLDSLPFAIASALGHGEPWAIGPVYGLELVAKYLIARWAISPIIDRRHWWPLATLAAVMLPWAGQWRAHNMPQQLSAVFLLVALGAAIRLRSRMQPQWAALAFLGALFSLLSYEALVLCAVAMPLVVVFGRDVPSPKITGAMLRISAPIAGAIATYSILFFAAKYMRGSVSYYAILLANPTSPWLTPLELFMDLYRTAYINAQWTLPFMMAFAWPVIGPSMSSRKTRQIAVLTVAALALLPLLALPFSVNFYFLQDIERTGLPIGFGFFLLCVFAFARLPIDSDNAIGPGLVLALLIGSAGNAYNCWRPYAEIQWPIIHQIKAQLADAPIGQPLLVRDWTGTLGDMYTFLNPYSMQLALAEIGVRTKLDLCTPVGVDLIHPVLSRYGAGSPVARCTETSSGGKIVIDIRPGPVATIVAR